MRNELIHILNNATLWSDDANWMAVQEQLDANIVERNARLYTVHALPLLVPNHYNVNYQPQFLVFESILQSLYRNVAASLEAEIQQDVDRLTLITVMIGLVGMVVSLVIVWNLSATITQPLIRMQHAANDINS